MVILAIIFGLLPGFVWLFFYLQEDVHPEPRKMIFKVFLAGAFFTFIIWLVEFAFQELLKYFSVPEYDAASMSGFAIIEEVLKFAAAYLVVRRSKFFDEPIDAMIYMIVAALGVATVENVLVALNTMSLSGLESVFETIILRFLGATLLHALSSGIVGYYWAVGMLRNSVKSYIARGLVFASLLHIIFNYLILIFNENVLVYPTLFLVIAAFFIFYDFEKLKSNRE
jgi:RsiW-degrading membrane proteinase PrsW (M82 family)